MADARGEQFGGGPGWNLLPPQPPAQQMPPSLMEMAQGVAPQMTGGRFGGGPDFALGGGGGGGGGGGDGSVPYGGLPTNGTPEGDQYARRYANHLAWMAGNPHMENDNNSINTIAGFGADYTRANNITYDPPPDARYMNMGGGFRLPGDAPPPTDYGSGFRMGGKPMAWPQVLGDVGRQLNRIPPALRDALGPAVVQFMHSSGAPGFAYPGSARYAGTVPIFEPNDSYRMNRDAWGRGFALGSSDMPHPTRPRP